MTDASGQVTPDRDARSAEPAGAVAAADGGRPGAREIVLARIRAARGEAEPPRVPPVEPPAGLSGDALLELLTDRLVDYKATVVPTTAAGLAVAIAGALAAVLPDGGQVVRAPGVPPEWCPGAIPDDGAAGPGELDGFAAVLSGCAGAAAETGTIALDGSSRCGRRAITLVPDRHLCVVNASQVVHSVPELLAGLEPSRPLTLVSGPSATSDIELIRVEGVHGPRTLVVLLVQDA